MMNARTRNARGLVLAALLSSLGAGCAETTPNPVLAGVGQQGGAAAPQFAMSDAPSSGGESANRPALSGAALEHYQKGMEAFSTGNLVAAKGFFSQAVVADANAFRAHYSLGVVQERLRDGGAAESYRRAFSVVPDYEPAIAAYALLIARSGRAGDAESFLNEKRAQLPKSAAILATLAEVKSIVRDSGSAQQLAQEALKLNPDYRPAMVTIARDHYRNRRLDLSLYALQAILDGFEPVVDNPPRDKNNAEAHLLRGTILKEQGRRSAAIDAFRAALSRRPDLVEGRVQLAVLLLESGGAAEALALLEGAVRFDGDNVPARLALGDAYRLAGNTPAALREFAWVKAREPAQAEVYYNLGLLYLFAPEVAGLTPKAQVEAATEALKKYQEVRPKGRQDDSDELLGRAKLKLGELEAAAAAAAAPPPVEPAPAAPVEPVAQPAAVDPTVPAEPSQEESP